MIPHRLPRPVLAVAALAGSVALAVSPSAVGASTPALPLPEDLQFLDNETIDEIVAGSEGGRPECAALTGVISLTFISAFYSMGESMEEDPLDTSVASATGGSEVADEGGDELEDLSLEAIYAVFAPVIVPLIHRAAAPTDATVASQMVDFGTQLTGAIYELRELGFTDDDLLEMQQLLAGEWSAATISFDDPAVTEAAVETVAPSPELEEKLETLLVDHDFESLTFFDQPTSTSEVSIDAALPWIDECPETASMLDFFDTDFSAEVDVEMEVTADSFDITVSSVELTVSTND